ncbi:hypothetical protein CHS0354_001867 [Potamilus streckersoni]|uniref:Uncharacterized protein n=1 Tax=Potamilus streckersoni TaxID=2493646 RepID=A0AAE0WCK6_9BIVA|nr:hypothetical protein CHS0354_001867 [Potamilus streckersoni]
MENSIHYTSPNHADDLIGSINKLRQQQNLCDVIIYLGDLTLPAHRLVLTACSPYFSNLFCSRGIPSGGSVDVLLEGLNPKSVESIIEFFYTCAISVTDDNVWDILPAASTLQALEIQNVCSGFLSSQIQLKNCMQIYDIACQCNCMDLKNEAADFIQKNFDMILQEDTFCELSFREMMCQLKQLMSDVITEDELYKAIISWILQCAEERQQHAAQIVAEFPNLKSHLLKSIPEEYFESPDSDFVDLKTNNHSSYKDVSIQLRATCSGHGGNNHSDHPSGTKSRLQCQDAFKTNSVNDNNLERNANSNHSFSSSQYEDKKPSLHMCLFCSEVFLSYSNYEEHVRSHAEARPKSKLEQSLISLKSIRTEKDSPKGYGNDIDSLSDLLNHDDMELQNYSHNKSENLTSNRGDILIKVNPKGSPLNRIVDISPHFDPESLLGPDKETSHPVQKIEVRNGKHICPICDKLFSGRKNVMKHIRTVHSDSLEHSCDICSKKYSTKSNLQIHMRTHSGERPFACTHCDKSFNTYCVLRIHLRTHTGEKPFVCSTCGIAFAKNIHLKRHVAIHTGEKPHECDICRKRFSRSDHLKRHIQSIHTQSRPHICVLCGKDFVRKYELNKHLKVQHSGLSVTDLNASESGSLDGSLMQNSNDMDGSETS